MERPANTETKYLHIYRKRSYIDDYFCLGRPPWPTDSSISTGSFVIAGSLAYCRSQSRRGSNAKFNLDGEFCSSRPPSQLPVLILFTEGDHHDVIGYPIRMDKDHDVFWASNSTEQDVQLAVGKTVNAKVDSDKIDFLTLTIVTGHRACKISGQTSTEKYRRNLLENTPIF
ncbi:hypothetical protein J6590_093069 [Homalodisca vitripennis]|nr:hypothetical protein J6590_093069 [Homalodisca vitripennis]